MYYARTCVGKHSTLALALYILCIQQSSSVGANTEAAVMFTDVVVNITSQPEQVDASVIAVTTTLIENLTQTAIQQPEVHNVIQLFLVCIKS